MCGIAGVISSEVSEQLLNAMLQKQTHRGPDHSQIYIDPGFAGLGHNRLSIIDLSSSANQPFSDNSGRYFISFNGEIYNYKELREDLKESYDFKTKSDTEVLLASYIVYGKDCLNKLNGMFSFAIWDTKNKSLFAARDRFGVKPFYYSSGKGQFIFASEIKTLLVANIQRKPNQKVWANYFSYGSYGLPSETFYEGISQLPGGFYLEYKKGVLRKTRWYDFIENVNNIQACENLDDAKTKYLQILRDSVALRFRADVPVGFNLSGGLDSSLLLALVNKMEDKQNIEAFTFYCDDERYDELFWVQQMIGLYKNPLNKIKFLASEVPDYSKNISYFQDEPFGGIPTLAYSKIFKAAVNKGVKVLLDGQGMDEQWAGYDYYANLRSNSTIQGQPEHKSPFKVNCINEALLRFAEKPKYPTPFTNDLQNLQYRDLFYTKIPRALRFNDRISMASSAELREPFLDYRLVEFAFAQTDRFKIKDGVHKILLRELVKDIVPKDVVNAPKRPLQTPQREWLGDDLDFWVEAQLKSLREGEYASWFNIDELLAEWNIYKSGERKSSFHIWQWINFAILTNTEV